MSPQAPEMCTPASEAVHAQGESQLLGLQALEQSMVRAVGVGFFELSPADFDIYRYAIRLAALEAFVPASAAGSLQDAVKLDQQLLMPLRKVLLGHLNLTQTNGARARQKRLSEYARRVTGALSATRQSVLRQHAQDFSDLELDAELEQKKLVLAAGGGGGAGYVYLGALARLQQDNLVPDYIVGSSIGAFIGALVAKTRNPDYASILEDFKAQSFESAFSLPGKPARYSLPGLMRLHMRDLISVMSDADGRQLRLNDLEIPYDPVVGGVRRLRIRPSGPRKLPRAAGRRTALGTQLSGQIWRLSTLITPSLLDEIVLGRDDLTAQLPVIEAMGFSAAIPGFLHFHPWQREQAGRNILREICRQRDLVALIDGGVVNNVPAQIAWRGVRAGRIGTRNVFYLGFDCFRPQAHRKHAALWPITHMAQLQMPVNRPYFDWLIQFGPTLSPANLIPTAADLDRSWQWGWEQMGLQMPMFTLALSPIERSNLPWVRPSSGRVPRHSKKVSDLAVG
ncbi:putative esterase of the alpha-beta hydrolase superfamily protein [Oceanococcus atlanticus]|uniref:Putative esterase of the alpha-beta hydrolase superfamily protein n=2 Tax=Oceanococcus atlanticus TaxID=1317117 RepID=A0A1Y1SDT2_9GAMM|nr:putative esterase of the alpha-beta hydrolase superfamily protein [Oceanococcus atlanticus]